MTAVHFCFPPVSVLVCEESGTNIDQVSIPTVLRSGPAWRSGGLWSFLSWQEAAWPALASHGTQLATITEWGAIHQRPQLIPCCHGLILSNLLCLGLAKEPLPDIIHSYSRNIKLQSEPYVISEKGSLRPCWTLKVYRNICLLNVYEIDEL